MKTTLKLCSVYSIVSAALLLGGLSAWASSQTYTNTPVDQTWTNAQNWDGGAYPGSINGTANTGNNTVSDIATFNTPIPASGIGGARKPILVTDSSNASRSLEVGGITFDTANCGAYVFQTNTPCNYAFWTTPTAGSSGSNGCLYVVHSHAITINSTVNNSQTFLVPVFIRLPSSTAGNFSFVNNSANPAATLWFNAITNDSSNTRGTVYILDGSNTGTNTIQYLSKGTTTSGAMGLTKQGTGTWTVQNIGGGDFPKQSANNINDGKLIVVDSGMWGASSGISVNSNAVEELVGVNQTNTTMNGNGTVLLTGTGSLSSVALGTGIGTTPHLQTTAGGVLTVGVLGQTASLTGGSATSVLNINGPGTVLLATNSTYVGDLLVDSGTLQVGAGSALGTGPSANVAAGGILDLTPLGSGIIFNPTTAGIGGSGAGTAVGSTAATIKPDAAGTLDLATGNKNILLTYTPTSSSGDLTHPALYISQGTLDLGGNTLTVDNASGTPLGVGTYVLIQVASGNINNAGNLAANVTGSGVAVDTLGTIQISGGQVELVVAPYTPQTLSWQGGNPNENWDVGTTPNWFNGGASSVFNDSDMVTFNAAGASNPVVNLVGAIIPSSIVVDTTKTNYVFGGSGSISGEASLTKIGTGTLVISNMNDYIGSTVISNGTVQLDRLNGLSDNSDISISNTATLDLNTFTASIGALNGGGTVDTVAGGSPVLTVGNNADNGTFSGSIKNTVGTLAVTKGNTGTETLAGVNTYSGATTVNGGVLRAANLDALGSGASAVTVNSGTILDISTNVLVASIAGIGTVENDSTTTTNQIDFEGSSTITGAIVDGSGGGAISVLVSGTLAISGTCTYSGGTIIASGATLQLNDVAGSEAGTGGITASNNANIGMPQATSSSAVFNNTITTVNNASVTFTSAQAGNEITGEIVGGITSTDIIAGGNITIGGNGDNQETLTNFLGTVLVTNGTVRSFGNPSGGQEALFDFVGLGAWNSRDGGVTVHFGALAGDPTATILGPTGSGSNPNTPDTYIIGEANENSVYSGSISGTNNIVKAGTGTLTLNGGSFTFTNTYTEGFEQFTSIGYGSNSMFFVGSTTISNGVLALVAPEELTNSSPITLAGVSAVLDASAMGYISNELDDSGNPTNSFPVTNGIFEVVSGQTLNGVGTLKGILLDDQGSTFNPGLTTGAFNVTSNANLSGAVIMNLDDTNAVSTNSELVAQSITLNPTATLLVTNVGPGLFNGSTFVLFNHPVSFASVTLPATDPTGGTNYVWANHLSSNGSITLTSGGLTPGPTTPPPLSFSISGNTLMLSWPSAYAGYVLQVETNSLSVGLSNNWVNVPNSTSVLSTNITVNPNVNGTVFYRLVQ